MRTLIALLILAVFGYFWNNQRERFNEWEALASGIKVTEDNITRKEKEKEIVLGRLKPLKEKKENHSDPDDDPAKLEKDIEGLKEAIKNGTTELDAAEADYQAAVESVREKAKKETFPLVKLASGQELKNATITKFGEGFVNISHGDGNVRVQAEDLPEGWVARYALDYVSRESKAENDIIASRIERANTAPLDLSKAKLAEVNARIADLDAQLLELSGSMRNSLRTADKLVRQGYQEVMAKGSKGQAAAAKRKALFDQSDKERAARLETQKKYKALRDEKLELEKKRVELSARR